MVSRPVWTLPGTSCWRRSRREVRFPVAEDIGQVNVNAQSPVTAVDDTWMPPTKPLAQSFTSVNRTVQLLDAGAPVVSVSGGDAHDTFPAASRASTFTV